VRAFPELSDEFRIEISTDKRKGTEVVTVVIEAASEDDEPLRKRLRQALREALGVTPEVRRVPVGTLERTVFKAKRILDLRAVGG